MSLLLDTHALLWAALSPQRLSKRAREAILSEQASLFVSAASAWEIATKVRAGRLPEAERYEADFVALTQRAGYILLPMDAELALRAGRLRGQHGDPFDRMIAAQALTLDVELLSADKTMDEFLVRRLW